MLRGVAVRKALALAALIPALFGGCTSSSGQETRKEHVERLLKARFGKDVVIQNLDVSGKAACGWSNPGGVFLIDGDEFISWRVDPDRLRDCGPDFAGPGPSIPPVE